MGKMSGHWLAFKGENRWKSTLTVLPRRIPGLHPETVQLVIAGSWTPQAASRLVCPASVPIYYTDMLASLQQRRPDRPKATVCRSQYPPVTRKISSTLSSKVQICQGCRYLLQFFFADKFDSYPWQRKLRFLDVQMRVREIC